MNACTNEYPHKTGEYVSYKNNGICKIVDIVTKEFAGMDSKTYYELQMVFDQGNVLYIPVDAENLVQEMRHVLSAQEIEDVIVQSEQYQDMWIDDGKARAAQYEEILAEGDRSRILWIIKTLSAHRKQTEQNKKKMYAADAKVLASAEKIIKEEFAFTLGIDREQVIPYIIDQLRQSDTASSI